VGKNLYRRSGLEEAMAQKRDLSRIYFTAKRRRAEPLQ
jgi:hypothetical protein